MLNKIVLNLPQNINIVIWRNLKNNKIIHIVIHNKNNILKFYIKKNSSILLFDKNSNSLVIEKNFINDTNNKFSRFLKRFLKSWDNYFFKKIKFKGKGFRMRFLKKNKLVKFFFGRSHKTFIIFKKIILKKISKYKFILKSINPKKLSDNSSLVTKIKPLNVYTLRGLRFSRQTIFKRKGKKGTYI